jgi:hypothetical protein
MTHYTTHCVFAKAKPEAIQRIFIRLFVIKEFQAPLQKYYFMIVIL